MKGKYHFALWIALMLFLLVGAATGRQVEQSADKGLAADIARLGLAYRSHEIVDDRYVLVFLEDGGKILASMQGDHLIFGGLFSRDTGRDVLGELAVAHGALSPLEALSLIGKPSLALKSKTRETPDFSIQDFEEILESPGVVLFPDRPKDASTLVMFTWSDCPSCERMRQYFERHKTRIDFQVLFVPIVGNTRLNEDAIDYLGLGVSPPNVRQSVLEHLQKVSDILGSRSPDGRILVPAFAWAEPDGQAYIGNLDGKAFRNITMRLNKGVPLE